MVKEITMQTFLMFQPIDGVMIEWKKFKNLDDCKLYVERQIGQPGKQCIPEIRQLHCATVSENYEF